MLSLLVYLIVIAVVIGIGYWIIDAIPVPQPLNRWVKIILVVVGAIVLIMVLLQATGTDVGFRGGPVVR